MNLINKVKNYWSTLFQKEILIKYHNQLDGVYFPLEQLEVGDWIDLHAAETVELKAGEQKLVSLGISMKLPKGYEAWIAPRSSAYKHWAILQTNTPGIIDNKFCGEEDIWKMSVLAFKDGTIQLGERICQFRIIKSMGKVKLKTVEHMTDTSRGGFGSTGK